jgi:regulatory protein
MQAQYGAGGNRRSRRRRQEPADPVQAIQKDMLRYLQTREHSVFELRSYLKRRRHESELIDQTIGEVQELGYVDDRRFAEMYLRDRARLRPASRTAIARELRAKGVADEIIAEAFEAADPPWSDVDMAWESVARRWARWPEDKRFQKATGFLQRRGFTSAVTMATVARLRSEEQQEIEE